MHGKFYLLGRQAGRVSACGRTPLGQKQAARTVSIPHRVTLAQTCSWLAWILNLQPVPLVIGCNILGDSLSSLASVSFSLKWRKILYLFHSGHTVLSKYQLLLFLCSCSDQSPQHKWPCFTHNGITITACCTYNEFWIEKPQEVN